MASSPRPIDEFFDAVDPAAKLAAGKPAVLVGPAKPARPVRPAGRLAGVRPGAKAYKPRVLPFSPTRRQKPGDRVRMPNGDVVVYDARTARAHNSRIGRPAPADRSPKLTRATAPVTRRAWQPSQGDVLAAGLVGSGPAARTQQHTVAAIRRANRRGKTSLSVSGGDLKAAADLLIGPNITNALTGHAFNPYLAPVEALGIIPGFGKIGRVAEAAVEAARAVRAGEGAGRAARAAADVVTHGRRPPDRIIRLGDGFQLVAPAAPQRHIRLAQHALDRNLVRVVTEGAKHGLSPSEALAQKTLAARLAAEHLGRLTNKVWFWEEKGAEAGIRALAAAHVRPEGGLLSRATFRLRHPLTRLTDPQLMALRQLAINVHPNVSIEANLARIAAARNNGDMETVRALRHMNTLLASARHYIEGDGNKIRLRTGSDRTTRDLARVWEEMQRVGRESEQTQIRLGELTPEQAAARRNQPGILDLAAAGHDWNGHEGVLYYPSAMDTRRFSPSGAYRTRSEIIPFRPRPGSRKPWTGKLQETGRESHRVTDLIARQALARASLALAIDRLEQLRSVAKTGELPSVGDLEKTYRAIRMIPTPDSYATERLRTLLANAERKSVLTPQEEAQIGEALHEVKNQMVRHLSEVVEGARLPRQFGLVHQAFVEALNDPGLYRPGTISEFHRAWIDASSLVKDMIVYTKIGHMPPRLISNTLMVLPDTGWDFVTGVRLMIGLRRTRPDLYEWAKQASGAGYYRAYGNANEAFAHQAVRAINRGMVSWIEKTADAPPRVAALLAFAVKDSGRRDLPGMIRYLERLRSAEPGTEAWHARTWVVGHTRQAAGEYERIGRDAAVSNLIFLYRWLKAASAWTTRFAVTHPVQAAGVGYLTSQYGYQAANPIWNRFNIAGHNYQTAVPWSTPTDIAERLAPAVHGGFPAFGSSPLDLFHPIIPTLATGALHVDIERGERVRHNSWLAAGKNLYQQTPVGATVSGKHSLQYRLLKYFLGNFAPSSSSSGGTSLSRARSDLEQMVRHGLITRADYNTLLQALQQAEQAGQKKSK